MQTHDLPLNLEALANGTVTADSIFSSISNEDVARLIFSRFEDDDDQVFALGESILEGDVAGHLVLSKDLTKAIYENNNADGSTRYIYSIADPF